MNAPKNFNYDLISKLLFDAYKAPITILHLNKQKNQLWEWVIMMTMTISQVWYLVLYFMIRPRQGAGDGDDDA